MSKLITYLLYSILLYSCAVSKYAPNTEYPQIETAYRHKGLLEEIIYKCSKGGPAHRRMFVYLPSGYYDTTASYPVFYLLHGARGNEISWIVKGNLLHNVDSLIANGKISEMIIVLPNTNQYDNDRDYGKSRIKGAVESFFENDGSVESSFVDDVVAIIDSTYRTIPEKSHRAIGGLSIGALQALHISASFPDTFGYVGLFSPLIRPVARQREYYSFYSRLKKRLALQFEAPPQLYMVMIGRYDFFRPRVNTYCNYLKRKGYRHEFFISPGGHDWDNWEEYNNIFMEKLWK